MIENEHISYLCNFLAGTDKRKDRKCCRISPELDGRMKNVIEMVSQVHLSGLHQ